MEYFTKAPQSKTFLEEWYEKTKKAEWNCIADIKETFNNVDDVDQRYIFNIEGKAYDLLF